MATRKRRHANESVRATAVPEPAAHAPLLEAIVQNPDELAAWDVYADLLQTAGHPRGELISLMLEREQRPSLRLFQLERQQLAVHAAALGPSRLPAACVVGWRRGFPSELRLDQPEQLALAIAEPSLRLASAGTLVVDLAQWDAWATALAATQLPWRALRVELQNQPEAFSFAPAPIFACASTVERAQLELERPPHAIDWSNTVAPKLVRLALRDAGVLTPFPGAQFPALAELYLLGNSRAERELRTSKLWSRLRRVVGEYPDDHAGEAPGPVVHPIETISGQLALGFTPTPEEEAAYSEARTTAYFVVGQHVDVAVLKRLANNLAIDALAARVATLDRPRPLTAIQLWGGIPGCDAQPYAFALALQHVLGSVPIALVEIDEDRAARYLVLGEPLKRDTGKRPELLVRRAIDIALGCDPGASILQDLLVELAAVPQQPLRGTDSYLLQLTAIDPTTPSCFVPDVDEYADDDDEEEDEDDYEYYDDYDVLALQYEEPEADPEELAEEVVPTRPMVAVAGVPVAIEPVIELAADSVDEVEPSPSIAIDVDVEDALVPIPVREELWLDFREHWDDRAGAPDDDAPAIRRTLIADPEQEPDLDAELDRMQYERYAEPPADDDFNPESTG